MQSIILGIGTGRCGTGSLAKVLNQQTDAVCSFEEPPLLPWKAADGPRVIRERFARFRHFGKARLLGDCASFYLPYVEDAIAAEPDVRIVCLMRPREEVVTGFCRWLDQAMPLPTNHWAKRPSAGWHHDPLRARTYPSTISSPKTTFGKEGAAWWRYSTPGPGSCWFAARCIWRCRSGFRCATRGSGSR
jgi:hypothetical protein